MTKHRHAAPERTVHSAPEKAQHSAAPAEAEQEVDHGRDSKVKEAREVLKRHFASAEAVDALEIFIRAISR